MTVERTPGSIENGLYQSIRKMPADLLESATGLTLDALYQQSNPNNPTRLSADVAFMIDAARVHQGKGRVFHPLLETVFQATLARLGGVADGPIKAPQISPIAKEVADILAVRERSMEDGVLTVRELQAELKEAEEARDAIEAHCLALTTMIEQRKEGAA